MRQTVRGGMSNRPHRYMTTAERFDAQHVTVPEAGCWLWTGTLAGGYGQFRADGVIQCAHRYSLSRKLGRPIAEGMLACHRCDTPVCVNPDHLYEGTLLDNAADAVSRGQQLRGEALASKFKTRCHGNDHHSNKLSISDVEAIRRSAESLTALATTYRVSKSTISKIRKELTWKHLLPKEQKA